MIDVVFLLLIFFAVTGGSGTQEFLMSTDLAASGSVASVVEQPSVPPPLTVEITLKLTLNPEQQQVHVDMNGTSHTDLEELKSQLRALAELGPENPVLFDVAADVPLGSLVEIYDTCQQAGFETINFAARSPVSLFQ